MLKKNQILTLTINGMTFAGFGVAHYSDEELSRFAIFIQNAIEGDVIRCRIVKVQKTYAYGIIEEIITPSPARITPKCPVFEKCGGCVYLNATYEEELKYKSRLAADSFRNETYEHPQVLPCEPSPVTEHYRNKVTYPLSPDGKFGFYARNSHRCIINKDCVQQYEEFVPVLTAAEDFIKEYGIKPYDEVSGKGVFRNLFMRRASSTGEISVCAIINADRLPHEKEFAEHMSKIKGVTNIYINVNKKFGNEILGKEFRCIWGKEKITEKLCGLDFNISPAAFFQINKAQTERLYSYAVDAAQITENDTVLDLYCGIGTITLTAASRSKAKEFIGIEIVPQAIDDAKENAGLNGIDNVSFYCADASTVKEVLKKNGSDLPSVIIVDPPRKGLGKETSEAIVSLNPQKVVYISCNPLTQAQDLRTFTENGYKIEFIKPFDMFPRTQHVETVVCLSRENKNPFEKLEKFSTPLLYRAAQNSVYGQRYEFETGSITDAMFVYLDGSPSAESVASLDSNYRLKPLVCLTGAWEEYIKKTFPNAHVCNRYMMKPSCQFLTDGEIALPDGFRVALFDEKAFSLHPFSHGENYSSFAAFQEYGTGAVVWHNDKIVASASSFITINDEIELDVSTEEAYRGKGLASACISLMLQDCAKRRIVVHWDAQNEASLHLAEKFGFEQACTYCVYFLPKRITDESIVCLSRKTTHEMKLHASPFEKIKNGVKNIEMRLFDEKRQKIKAGDDIIFTNTASGEKMCVSVKKLHLFGSFEELYKTLPLLQCGYTADDIDTAHPSDMEQYYSEEEQRKYGVVGIELFPPKQITDEYITILKSKEKFK